MVIYIIFIDTDKIVTVTLANQNFSKVSTMADEYGNVVLFKNNKPQYVLTNIEKYQVFELTDDEKLEVVAKRILAKYKVAF